MSRHPRITRLPFTFSCLALSSQPVFINTYSDAWRLFDSLGQKFARTYTDNADSKEPVCWFVDVDFIWKGRSRWISLVWNVEYFFLRCLCFSNLGNFFFRKFRFLLWLNLRQAHWGNYPFEAKVTYLIFRWVMYKYSIMMKTLSWMLRYPLRD